MQAIRHHEKTPHNVGVFSWLGLRVAKITFPDDPEADTQKIRELLDALITQGNV